MKKNYKNNYPCIFLHGFAGFGEKDDLNKIIPYWGFGFKNLLRHLRKQGIECYNPSLGPFDGAWDRSCELYAYLFGGTVDYGKVHSREHHHERYGRTYEHGVLEDLGKTEEHKKINLFGHSFGGPTVKQFVELMKNGSEIERANTDESELNPLFKGGKENLIHTVTTLSGVNNGTALANHFGKFETRILIDLLFMINAMLSETKFPKLWDFHLQKWGAMDFPENIKTNKLTNPLKGIAPAKLYNSNKIDNIAYEMHVDLVQDEINPSQEQSDKIYYFCQRAYYSYEANEKLHLPYLGGNIVCFFPAFITGREIPKKLSKYGVDKSWLKNDGFVNTAAQGGPFDKPQEDGEIGKTDFKPGIWYNMPIVKGDHLSWNGMSGKRKEYFKKYDDMIDLYRSLPDA